MGGACQGTVYTHCMHSVQINAVHAIIWILQIVYLTHATIIFCTHICNVLSFLINVPNAVRPPAASAILATQVSTVRRLPLSEAAKTCTTTLVV